MRRIARGALLLSILALAGPAGAAAASSATTATGPITIPTTTTTTPTVSVPPPVVVPVRGKLRMSLEGAFRVHSQTVTVPGHRMRVDGFARPFVAGQTVVVKIRIGHSLVKSGTYRLKRSSRGIYGHFSIPFSTASTGKLSITAFHKATPELAWVAATPEKVAVLAPNAGPGSAGMFVSLIQSRLAALHYAVPLSGYYDQLTANAVLAYRKVRGWARIYTLDGGVVAGLLKGVGTFHVRFPRQGRHVEANLTTQTLALIDGSKVLRIYPISSGKPSTPTVLGTYHVYLRTPGYLPDGMYYSSFFIGGYAIHGYDPAPTYPASHGCLRLPIDEAIQVYNWITYGTTVDVYYG